MGIHKDLNVVVFCDGLTHNEDFDAVMTCGEGETFTFKVGVTDEEIFSCIENSSWTIGQLEWDNSGPPYSRGLFCPKCSKDPLNAQRIKGIETSKELV
jgi:hypothetical protein